MVFGVDVLELFVEVGGVFVLILMVGGDVLFFHFRLYYNDGKCEMGNRVGFLLELLYSLTLLTWIKIS